MSLGVTVHHEEANRIIGVMLGEANLTLMSECISSLDLGVVMVFLVREFVMGNWVRKLVIDSEFKTNSERLKEVDIWRW